MSTYALDKLLELRRKAEEDTALVLARAAAAAFQAKTAHEILKHAVSAARRVWEQERAAAAVTPESAEETLARHRFVDRLGTAWNDQHARATRFRAAVLEPAARAEEIARQAYLTTRQEREAVERHLERRRAAARLAADRRSEQG